MLDTTQLMDIRAESVGHSFPMGSSSTPRNIREAYFTQVPISPEHGDCWISSVPASGDKHVATILLASGGQGGGHLSPMDAVSYWLQGRDDVRVVYIDDMPVHTFPRNWPDHMKYKLSNTNFGASLANEYRATVSAAPQHHGVIDRARTAIAKFGVDYVFTNHRFIAYALSEGQQDDVPLAVGLADPGKVHQGWYVPRLKEESSDNTLFTTNALTTAHAIKHGVPEGNIQQLGYPVRPQFADVMLLSREDVRQELNIPLDKRVLMVTAGNARDPGTLVKSIRPLLTHEVASDLYIMVLAGNNVKLGAELEAVAQELNVSERLRILPTLDADQMAKHMRAANLMACQPGGGTLGECFALEVVPILWGEKSGIEHSNRKMIERTGTGIVAFDQKALEAAVFGDGEDHKAMVLRQKDYIVEDAAGKIAAVLTNDTKRFAERRAIVTS